MNKFLYFCNLVVCTITLVLVPSNLMSLAAMCGWVCAIIEANKNDT